MKKGVVFCIIILILLAGCIKIKDSNCEAKVGDDQPLVDVVGKATVTNIGQPLDETNTVQESNKDDLDPTDKDDLDPNTIIKEVVAGEMVSFPNLDASDPDGEAITYSFTKPLNAQGEWQTSDKDIGEYLITITISDGANKISQDVLIRIIPRNHAPVIEAPEEITIEPGDTLKIPLKITDSDNDKTSTRYSGWITSIPYEVKTDDVGVHIVRVHASDGNIEVVHEIKVTVKQSNSPPVIEKIQDVIINESSKITIKAKVSDPDGDEVKIIYSAPLNEEGTWTPRAQDEGKHEVFITASDGKVQSSSSFFIIVEAVNKAPVISGIEDLTVNEGETLRLNFVINDPEGDEVITQITGYMNSTSKEIPFDDAGVHTVRITASDGQRSTTVTFLVTVEEVNRPPVFTPDAFE